MKRKSAGYILLAAGLLFVLVAGRFPRFIETVYSGAIFPWLAQPLSLATGLLPFSLAELALVALFCWGLVLLVRGGICLAKAPRPVLGKLPRNLARLAAMLAAVYLVFNLMWGLNYSRLTFARIACLPVEAAPVEELAELARHLTHKANELRDLVDEDDQGVMMLSGSIRDMFARSDAGFAAAAQIYPELGGKYGRPKGVFLSRLMSVAGITGIYIPFTAEANVNTHIPPSFLPVTTTHEMAHQRGFAREDEANFIGYLACVMHPDPDFQYSGVLLALVNTMNALARQDREAFEEIRELYSEGLVRDLIHWHDYWRGFEGPVERASTRINNSYLKANRQHDGVASYGRMVDLLLAEFRQKK